MNVATHNSATGERSKCLLHSLFSVFSKCQTKTIREQYEAGARYFDLRVDKNLVLCHGLWRAKKTLEDVVKEMRRYVTDSVYAAVTIEHNYSAKVIEWLKDGNETTLAEEEKKEINAVIIKYENSVRECIIEELNTEVEVDMPTISGAVFEKLMASNDWEAKTALFVADEIVTE